MLSWSEMTQRCKGSEVVLPYAKCTVHKRGAKMPKEGKKDKYRTSSFSLGTSK